MQSSILDKRARGGIVLCLAAVFCASSCEVTPSPDLDALTKAKLTKQYRDEAKRCLERWNRSDGTALEELVCFAEKHEATTVMHPSPKECPYCFANYGEALSLLGQYYYTSRETAEAELENAPPEERAELEARIQSAHEKVIDYFTRSNQMLEAYFSARVGVDPKAYNMARKQYAELGDYQRALNYLNLWAGRIGKRAYEANREKVDQLRTKYKRMIRQKRIADMKREMEDFDENALAPEDFDTDANLDVE